MLVFGIWVAYNEHVQPWIDLSLYRAHKIEQQLQEWGYNIRLHTLIKSNTSKGRGRLIRNFLVAIVIGVGFIRIILLFLS